MSSDHKRNEHGEYVDRIPAEAALEAFEARNDAARPLTATDIMETLDCSRRTAHNKLNTLVDQGKLETRKVGARGRVWWPPVSNSDPERPATEPHHHANLPSEVEQAIQEADLPGAGETLDARQEALAAAYEYLTDRPSATKSDCLDDIYPKYPAGFETSKRWWNAIRPALKQLPAVDPPKEFEHLWQFLATDRFTPTLG